MSEINDYLAGLTPAQKSKFEEIKKIVKDVAPDAEEVMSYGIPTFKYKKRPLIYFGAFKDHMSLFPASDSMVEALGEKVGKFRTGKGTLQFSEANPIPNETIKDIVLFQLKSIEGK